MSYGCAVPKCKGNYTNGPKVYIFSFLKENLANTWVRAIKRVDLKPNKTAK